MSLRRLLAPLLAPLLAALALGAAAAPADPRRETISIDWKDAQLTDALRLLAKVAHVNLVVDEAAANRTVTLALHDVEWRQALDLILATQGFGAEMDGNVLRVAPMGKLIAEEQQAAQLREAQQQSAPLRTIAFPLSWTSASAAEALARKSLSPRGSTMIDRRTNLLFVTDAFGDEGPTLELATVGDADGAERSAAGPAAFVDVTVIGAAAGPFTSASAERAPASVAAQPVRLRLGVGERADVPQVDGLDVGLERDGSQLVLVTRTGRTGAAVPAMGRQAVRLSSGAGDVLVVLDVGPAGA